MRELYCLRPCDWSLSFALLYANLALDRNWRVFIESETRLSGERVDGVNLDREERIEFDDEALDCFAWPFIELLEWPFMEIFTWPFIDCFE